MAADPQNEELTWEGAEEWWPYRPLLTAAGSSEHRERLFAWSDEGGTSGSPEERAILAVVLEAAVSADDADASGVIAGGGVVIEHTSPAMHDSYDVHSEYGESEQVVVRGNPGRLVHVATSHDQESFVIDWRTETRHGFALWFSGDHFSKAEALAFAEGLTERAA